MVLLGDFLKGLIAPILGIDFLLIAVFVLSPFQALIKMEMLNFLEGIFFVIRYAPLGWVLWFIQCNGGSWQCGKFQYCTIIAASLGALIGHVKSCGISFKGGKAVATVVGTLFALDWRVGLITAILWALIVFISNKDFIINVGFYYFF